MNPITYLLNKFTRKPRPRRSKGNYLWSMICPSCKTLFYIMREPDTEEGYNPNQLCKKCEAKA